MSVYVVGHGLTWLHAFRTRDEAEKWMQANVKPHLYSQTYGENNYIYPYIEELNEEDIKKGLLPKDVPGYRPVEKPKLKVRAYREF